MDLNQFFLNAVAFLVVVLCITLITYVIIQGRRRIKAKNGYLDMPKPLKDFYRWISSTIDLSHCSIRMIEENWDGITYLVRGAKIAPHPGDNVILSLDNDTNTKCNVVSVNSSLDNLIIKVRKL